MRMDWDTISKSAYAIIVDMCTAFTDPYTHVSPLGKRASLAAGSIAKDRATAYQLSIAIIWVDTLPLTD